MHIDFGWEFDHSPAAAETAVGTLRCGPRGLASLLATRLGVQLPVVEPARRVVKYRAALMKAVALGQANWCVQAFSKNRWAMATAMLRWRDELVENGWRPGAVEGSSSRLEVLAHVEALFNSPGAADVQRDVAERLHQVQAWPLGIESITLHFCTVEQLPRVWQAIFARLQALGVAVEEARPLSRLVEISLVTADTAYEAAPVVARMLANGVRTVLTGASTAAVDHELALRGHAALGRGDDGLLPTIPTFLAACTKPYDIRAISTLTMLRYPAGPLVPDYAGKVIRDTLAAAAGVGSPEWLAAFAEDLGDNAVAQDLDRLIREQPIEESTEVAADDLDEHLTWLRRRLLQLNQRAEADAVSTLRDILHDAGSVSRRELDSILELLTTTSHAVPQAQPGRVVAGHPAALPLYGEELLWWAPVDNTVTTRSSFTQAEYAQLRAQGVEVPQSDVLSPLSIAAQRGVVESYRRITAIVPAHVAGEATQNNPLLMLALSRVRDHHNSTALRRVTVKELGTTVSRRAGELVKGNRWELGGASVEITLPEQVALPVGDPYLRTFAGGEHLLPERLSYSQMAAMIHHPLEWLMERRLLLSPGTATSLAAGNQLHGTLVHKVVETLHGSTVAEEHIAAAFDSLIEPYAAELARPENAAVRKRLGRDALRAIGALNAALNAMGAAIAGNETPIEGVTLPELLGPGAQPIELRGQRDIDVTFRDGAAGIIDLKYTASKSRFRQEIRNNEELQLAVYARSLSRSGRDLSAHPVAYYSILQGEFFSPFPIFHPPHTGRTRIVDDPLTSLWESAVFHLTYVLDGLREGWVFDMDNVRALKGEVQFYPEHHERLVVLEESGLGTHGINKYTTFDFLTGLKGDFQ